MSGNPSEIRLKSDDRIALGHHYFDRATDTLFDLNHKIVPLRHRSTKVLARLADAPGELVLKDALISAAWPTTNVSDDSLTRCISDVRKVLGDRHHWVIKTVVGRGYRLNADQDKRQVGLPPKVFLENLVCSGNSQASANLADELYEKLIIALSPRTGIRLITEHGELEEGNYIISGRASVQDGLAKVFISLSESGEAGSFFAEQFNADIAALDRLCEQIVSKISNMQRLQIYTNDGRKYAEMQNGDLSTQELMAKAAYCFAPLTVEGSERAHRAIQAAVDRSPDNPVALCMLASTTTQMLPLSAEQSSEKTKQWAFSLADRAVATGARSEFAFRTRGNLRLWLKNDHTASEEDCARSLEIDPDFHLTHSTVATSELLSGSPEAGAERLEFVINMVPFHPQLPLFLSLQALANILSGETDEAISQAKEACERGPNVCWYKMIYATAVSQNRDIVRSDEFRELLASITLKFSHFRQMPFANISCVELLEKRLANAGFVGKLG